MNKSVSEAGLGAGAVLATVISFHTHESIVWAFLHGLCSWLYVIYFAVTR